MVQIINLGPSKEALQADVLQNTLGKALNEGLGKFTSNMFINKKMTEMENDKELMAKPLSDRLLAAQKALAPWGEEGKQYYQQRMEIEQQQEKQRRSQTLSKLYNDQPLTKNEEATLDPKDFEFIQKKKLIDKQKPLIKDALLKSGMPEDRAEAMSNLYGQASLGGQTELMKPISDFISRQGHETPQGNEQSEDFEWPKVEEPYKPTPSEEFKRSSKREDTNIPMYNDTSKKIQTLEQEGMSIGRLSQLSDKMPEGVLGKVNIDFKTGELIVPAGASPETQLYVKTINDFTTKAKDSYGSRVTNFDLSQFMKRLPTLANSKEGRELILKQMEIINELNLLHERGLKETFDHYGVGRVNSQQARKIADKKIEPKKAELMERYKSLDGLLNQMEQGSSEKVKVKSPDGKVGFIPSDRLEAARKAGYESI